MDIEYKIKLDHFKKGKSRRFVTTKVIKYQNWSITLKIISLKQYIHVFNRDTINRATQDLRMDNEQMKQLLTKVLSGPLGNIKEINFYNKQYEQYKLIITL